jgi:hypothetical protein
LWWISAVCARKVGSLLISSSFIVQLQENYGVRFSNCSVLFGLCMPRRVREMLERANGKSKCSKSLEVGSFVSNVVYLDRAK